MFSKGLEVRFKIKSLIFINFESQDCVCKLIDKIMVCLQKPCDSRG